MTNRIKIITTIAIFSGIICVISPITSAPAVFVSSANSKSDDSTSNSPVSTETSTAVSCFCSFWEFDREQNKWKIIYNEQYIKKHTVFDNLHFTDKTNEFKQTLLDIGEFAAKIEQQYFSYVFHNAYEALCGLENINDENTPIQLPDEFKTIYYVVDKADVFGAMGSWNDSPPYYAREKGLDKEYNELSNELLVQLRYHLMYVANECWKHH